MASAGPEPSASCRHARNTAELCEPLGLESLHGVVQQFIQKLEEENVREPAKWERLWSEGHAIDHLNTWEVCDRGPSYATLHQAFAAAMDRLTLIGLQLQQEQPQVVEAERTQPKQD